MAERLYEPPPSEAELRAIGITLEDLADANTVEIWPENWIPYLVFTELSTQWRCGPGGPIGLDYNVIPIVPSMPKADSEEYGEVFRALRILEVEALKQMSKKS